MKLCLLLAFNALFFLVVSQTTDETDKQALLEFKSGVLERNRQVLSSWNASLPLCNWHGVTCGRRHRRVTGLDLRRLKLIGSISPSIGNLSFLRSLNLADNYFHGVIPSEFGKLFRLQFLNMSNNFLQGFIPEDLSNCSNLLALDLSSNHLMHDVPSKLGSLSNLSFLSLGNNNLTGKIPPSLGNLTLLQHLDFINNRMEGEIPESISNLKQMVYLRLALNKFSGVFPPPIYNLSSLVFLSMTQNNFSGNLRPDFGNLLPNLQVLFLGLNRFTGTIPVTLFNISSLQKLDIPYNNLTGGIPLSIGKLQNLQLLGLSNNNLGNHSSHDLDFLDALTNCTQLQYLRVGYNELEGTLPPSIANFSTQLNQLILKGNLISGSIPHGISNLLSLQTLSLEENLLTGKLPASIGKLSNLGSLLLFSNLMSGELPSSLGNITQLTYIYLYNNSFNGNIPPSLGNCKYLLDLELGFNNLTGHIPQELMELPSLAILNVSGNSLVGSLPKDVRKLKYLIGLDTSYNKLSGQIPETLGNCLSLEYLWLQGNSFHGVVPDIRGLTGLKSLDLSQNNLTGLIPGSLVNISSLHYLNLSMNNFEGSVPTEGPFRNGSVVSVFGNENLCGGTPEMQLKPCFLQMPAKPRRSSSIKKRIAIGLSVGITSLLLSFIIVILCWFRRRNRKKRVNNGNDPSKPFHERISYEELHNATNGFCSENMIGSGNFGTVFKGFLGPENKAVAVKVLNLTKRGAAKSFMAECEVFKGIRHRNLVKMVTACSSIDFKGNEFRALIYDFMPNGSLDIWLHPDEAEGTNNNPSRRLTFLERLNIAIDVASVLDYLHAYCHNPIAHCDLKPSNVLLDDDLTAHVSDFGLARLLSKLDPQSFRNQFSSAGVRGTIGYVAPEYGMGGTTSLMGDVYSFGVLLLELFTGKRPTDETLSGDLTLHSLTKLGLEEGIQEISDPSMFSRGNPNTDITEFLKLIFDVGVKCTEESPRNRINMSVVVNVLVCIKDRFLKNTIVTT